MVVGYTASGIVGGLLAAASAMASGQTVLLIFAVYSLSGIAAMIAYGLIAQINSPRD